MPLPALTAAALVALAEALARWPLPIQRALWASTALLGAVIFARRPVQALLGAEGSPWPPPVLAALLVLAALSILSVGGVALRSGSRGAVAVLIGISLPLVGWSVSVAHPLLGALLCYPPIWAVSVGVSWWIHRRLRTAEPATQ